MFHVIAKMRNYLWGSIGLAAEGEAVVACVAGAASFDSSWDEDSEPWRSAAEAGEKGSLVIGRNNG